MHSAFFLLIGAVVPVLAAEIHWTAPIEIASGNGIRGAWRQNESVFDFVDDPTVVVGSSGEALVAWVDQKRKDVLFQIYNRASTPQFKEPINVSRTPDVFSWLPRLALSPKEPDHVYVLWQEIVFSGGSHGGEIFFARSADGGRTFEPPTNLSNSRNGDGKGRTSADHWHNGSLDIAVAPDGTIYTSWTEYDGPLWFSRSIDRGTSFSKPLLVAGTTQQPARAPALAVADSGRVYLGWTFGENPAADIHLSVSEDAGQSFSAPTVVAETPEYSDAPKLALTFSGTLHVVFGEHPGGREKAGHICHTLSTNGGRSFEQLTQLSRQAAFPALAAVGDKTVVIGWESYSSGGAEQPQGLGYAVSLDGGKTFSDPGIIASAADPRGARNGSSQGKLMRKLAANSGNDVAVVNSSIVVGEQSRVWLIRGEMKSRQGQTRSPSASTK